MSTRTTYDMEALKKLVCRGVLVEEDSDPRVLLHPIDDDADASQSSDGTWSSVSPKAVEAETTQIKSSLQSAPHLFRKNSFTRSSRKPFVAVVRPGMDDLAFKSLAKWSLEHAGVSLEAEGFVADSTVTVSVETNEDAFELQQINNSLCPLEISKGNKTTIGNHLVGGHDLHIDQYRIVHRKKPSDLSHTALEFSGGDESTASNRWDDYVQGGFCTGTSSNVDVDKREPCSTETTIRPDALCAGAESLSTASPRITPKQSQSILRRKVQDETYWYNRETRETRFILPRSHKHEQTPSSRTLACVPTVCSGNLTHEQTVPQNYLFFVHGREATTDKVASNHRKAPDECSTMSNVYEDRSFFSADNSSIGDDSRASKESVETLVLFYEHLFCSPNDQLISSDWLQ